MVYKPVDRSYDKKYLKEQHEVMRYLASLGVPHSEIREYTWGHVDEGDKVLKVSLPITEVTFNRKTGDVETNETMKEFKIELRGHEFEDFLLRSRINCPWMFTRERPKTWRKEGSKESLYSLSVIREICGKVGATTDKAESILTKLLKFANIEISKLNITNLKT